jgi:DNA-binding PadR family transcriptional regulator
VRNSILVLLLEEPRHGYSIIQVIEERTGGLWTPSPGSVYPTLAALEDEGLITASERDGKRVFSLTEEGRELATSISGDTPPWEPQANDPREMMHSLRQQIGGVAAAVMQVAQNGTPDQLHRAKEMLNELRKSLYRMLAEDDTPSS